MTSREQRYGAMIGFMIGLLIGLILFTMQNGV
jgi:tetrahydromethanopterin S-methyltransferase subunit G